MTPAPRVPAFVVILALVATAIASSVATTVGLTAQSAPPATPALDTLPVHGQVSLITGAGGNVAVQVGPQGVLVVDTGLEARADALIGAIRRLAGDRPIRYIVNTHAHADHTGGNLKVAAAGTQLVAGNFAAQVGDRAVQGAAPGAFIVAHENVLNALSAPKGGGAPAPFGGWPTDTFFQDERTMYFNGEGIQLVHEPSAHTDGDVLVFFRGSDVIAAGDTYVTDGFPGIDVAAGGSIAGVVESLNRLIDLAISEQFTEGGTRILPGHGRVSDEFDVVEYRDMATIVRDRVRALRQKGSTLAQVLAARPAFEYEPRYGTNRAWTTEQFVGAVYASVNQPAGTVSTTRGGNR